MRLSKIHRALERGTNEVTTHCGLVGYQEYGSTGSDYSTVQGSLFTIGEAGKANCGRCLKSRYLQQPVRK